MQPVNWMKSEQLIIYYQMYNVDSPENLHSSSKQHAKQKQTPKCLWSKGISVLSAA